ncbi:hypothetical protein KIPB_006237 [Kipferlia bialata]|uniref:Uncharacterized protein n=1 Tax=Kipferlia bialata TaxID=797122 RepID=A0A9K3CWW8_9EUKA|nr:hypothetical protein KIPB_006237 [Kipferlia bialata]|eukprot:g6237.t1
MYTGDVYAQSEGETEDTEGHGYCDAFMAQHVRVREGHEDEVLREFVYMLDKGNDSVGNTVSQEVAMESDMLPLVPYEEYENHEHFWYTMDEKASARLRHHQNKRHARKVHLEQLAEQERQIQTQLEEAREQIGQVTEQGHAIGTFMLEHEQTYRMSADEMCDLCVDSIAERERERESQVAAETEGHTYDHGSRERRGDSTEGSAATETETEGESEGERETETETGVVPLVPVQFNRDRQMADMYMELPQVLRSVFHPYVVWRVGTRVPEEATPIAECFQATLATVHSTAFPVDESALTDEQKTRINCVRSVMGPILMMIGQIPLRDAIIAQREHALQIPRPHPEVQEEEEVDQAPTNEDGSVNLDYIPADCVYLRVLPDPVRRRGCPHYIRRRGCPHYIRCRMYMQKCMSHCISSDSYP